MAFDDILLKEAAWLDGSGPMSDIAIATRASLSRNLRGHRFVGAATIEELAAVRREIGSAVMASARWVGGSEVELGGCPHPRRRWLVEALLCDPELLRETGERALAASADLGLVAVINQEDHLRLDAMRSGLDPSGAAETVLAVERELEAGLQFVYSEEFGFLTACPADVGTALRLSVLLHLPALAQGGDINRIMGSLAQLRYSSRPLVQGADGVAGDLYQISSRITLGRGEQDLVSDFAHHMGRIVRYEKLARESLREARGVRIADMAGRARGILGGSWLIGLDEALEMVGRVRLGVAMEMLPDIPAATLNRILAKIRPAHLRVAAGRDLAAGEEDRLRADLLRGLLP